jgi:hypothetical protein
LNRRATAHAKIARFAKMISVPLTWGFSPSGPTYLTAAIPARWPRSFPSLHLNDVALSGSGVGDLRLNRHERSRRSTRAEYEHAGGKGAENQNVAHAGLSSATLLLKLHEG